MNPLFDMLNGNNNPLVQQFMKFRQTFTGDAKAQVQQMLNSGQITQAQYDEAVRKAQQLQSMLAPGGRR